MTASVHGKKTRLDPMALRIRHGVENGLWFGVPLASLALIAGLVDYDAMRERTGMSPYVAAAFYVVCSIVVGAVTGILEKQLQSKAIALAFGFVVMIPIGAGVFLLTQGPAFVVSRKGIILTIAIAAAVGPMCANIVRKK
jgi:threonine/homoserine efflux transporter RhtA